MTCTYTIYSGEVVTESRTGVMRNGRLGTS
jgi:hypothetical protein